MEFISSEQQACTRQEAIDRVNQACYDNRADCWDRFPFPDSLPGLINKYHRTNLGIRVLDVGSGTGVLAKWLLDAGLDVECLDPSPEMVKRCQAKGLNALQGSIQAYQPKGTFAMIFAILSLIHVAKEDFSYQLDKLARGLPEGGILFLAMLEGQGEGICEGSDFPRFFAYYTLEELLLKSQPYFTYKESRTFKAHGIGYMLLVLEKKPL